MTPDFVHIHYLRPPDRADVYHQRLLLDRPDVKVTLAERMELELPIRIDGEVVLEAGSRVVWFTFPDRWHDIGRFYTADGGYYANVLTPPLFEEGDVWHTTDLFLDVWLPPGGTPSVLDCDQFDQAVRRGWIDEDAAERATAEVEAILHSIERGGWPPQVVGEWTLERAGRSTTGSAAEAASQAALQPTSDSSSTR